MKKYVLSGEKICVCVKRLLRSFRFVSLVDSIVPSIRMTHLDRLFIDRYSLVNSSAVVQSIHLPDSSYIHTAVYTCSFDNNAFNVSNQCSGQMIMQVWLVCASLVATNHTAH